MVRGGRLFDPGGGLDALRDLLIRGDRIAAVGAVEAAGTEAVVEAAGLLVIPGLTDMHVHLREPGQEHKETIATGTRAAAAGGFTRVVCEPNTAPPRDTPARIAEVLEIARQRAVVAVLPKCCITRAQEGKAVADLGALRAAGAAAASDDGFAVRDERVMREAMAAAKKAGIPLTVHVDGPAMVERDLRLAAEIGHPLHFSHVSLAEEVELIARAQDAGLRVTGEATPHHLVLCAKQAPPDDPAFKMSPPLGSARDRAALQLALRRSVISVIASDHAPHTAADKALGWEQAPAGVIGLETTLGVILTELVGKDLLDFAIAVRAMTTAPSEILGVQAPALRPGARADVTLIDPEAEWVVDPERFQSLARNCPFAGRRLKGKVVATIVAGRMVMRDGAILPAGAAA